MEEDAEEDDEEWEEWEEADTGDESEPDSPVLVLRCKACAAVLCRRGVSVTLIADAAVGVYSTDFATSATSASSEAVREIGVCACRIVDLLCRGCTRSRPGSRSSARATPIGYHVVGPCDECLSGGNNGHYFIFHADRVDASPWPRLGNDARPITWENGRLGLFDGAGRQPIVLAADDGAGEPLDGLPDELRCPICFDVLRAPVRLERCGHTFCEVCVTRHVDAHHSCPLDRRPACASEIAPDLSARRAVARLRVHCRFGCARPASFDPPERGGREPADADAADAPPSCRCAEWECGFAPNEWVPARIDGACGVTRALGQIGAHERRCPRRCACSAPT